MKNIQVIDGALNCTFSIFEATDEELALLFPEAGQEIQFAPRPRQFARAGRSVCGVEQNLERPIRKQDVQGIHGTLFYGLDHYKRLYREKRWN